ncbi:unnamed protein product, partial [Adineta steineri]
HQLSSSDSALAICSTSSDEGNKSLYPNEDDSIGLYNSSYMSYSHHHHKAPVPFMYGHAPTSAYGFGFNFYDEMSPFTDSTRSPYTFIHTTKRSDPNIDVKLENMELWKRFSDLNLEMIITKTGR